jgi:hypothetical protein
MSVEFPDRPAATYDVRNHAVLFPALVDGVAVPCLVTEEYLVTRSGGGFYAAREALRAYEEHRADIRRLAEAVIRRCGSNGAGVVCVSSSTLA